MKLHARLLTMTAALMLAGGAVAEEFGPFQDWFGEATDEGGAKVCSMWSTPQTQEGEYTRRGAVFVFVTHRPAAKRVGEVFVETGYPYKKGSETGVAIGGHRFTLITSGSTAWALSGNDERKLVAAMQAGADMRITGVSARGTETMDSYSLRGFTAAYKAISRACGVKQ